MKRTVAVIGGGSWGTSLIKILSDNENDKVLRWWVRSPEVETHIKQFGHNPRYISSVKIDTDIVNVSSDLESVIRESEYLIFAIPSAFVADTVKEINKTLFSGKKLISAIKGLVPESGQIMGEYFRDSLNVPTSDIAVIAGPCHAEEVSLEKLSFLTIASEGSDTAEAVADMLSCRYVKTSTSDDIYGTEYAAVLKNVYAVASGICHGLRFGDNFQAVLMSNAITEIKRFIKAVHPIRRDINASAYLGDLLVTGYSQFSRNRTFGNMLGKGYSVKAAQMEMNMIAEGYYATHSIHQLNEKYGVEMPLLEFVYSIIYGNESPSKAITELIPKMS